MTVRTQQSEYLKCFFTPEERSELSDKLVRAIAIKVEKEEEFKLVKKQFGEDIEAQTLATNRLARRLNFGYEHRNVVCDIILNSPEPGKKTIMRSDMPGEIVRVIPMDTDEEIEAAAAAGPPEKLFAEPPTLIEDVVQQINAGVMDTPGVTVTAEIREASDASNATNAPSAQDETSATSATKTKRSSKPKMQGQDALLNPDKRTSFPHGSNVGEPGVH